MIIVTFICFMTIIFVFHTAGSLGKNYSNFINIFLFFMGLLESMIFFNRNFMKFKKKMDFGVQLNMIQA